MVIKFLLFATFALFSFGQLGRLSFFNQEINIYLYEFLLVAGLLFFLLKYRFEPIKIAFKKARIIFLFIASLLFSYIVFINQYNSFQNTVSFLYLLRLISYLLYFLYLNFHIRREKHKQVLGVPIFIFFITTLIISFIQYFFYPDLQNLLYLGWDPHYHRMFGVFFDTSIAGAMYALSFLYILTLRLKTKRFTKIDYLFLLLFLASLILTFARSSYLALFIACFYFLGSRKTLRYGALITVIFIIILLIAPKQFGQGVGLTRTFSIASRISDYQKGVQIWAKHPLFGIGYNRLRYVREQMNGVKDSVIPSHAAASLSSSYLIVLICGGIIGLVLSIASIIRLMKINKEITTLILFTAVLSFFDNIFLHPFVMFLLGGFICRLNLSDRSRK